MIKIWGGSSRRAVNRKDAGVSEGVSSRYRKNQEVIDFDSFFTWFNEQEEKEAVGNELAAARGYVKKKKALKFLTL